MRFIYGCIVTYRTSNAPARSSLDGLLRYPNHRRAAPGIKNQSGAGRDLLPAVVAHRSRNAMGKPGDANRTTRQRIVELLFVLSRRRSLRSCISVSALSPTATHALRSPKRIGARGTTCRWMEVSSRPMWPGRVGFHTRSWRRPPKVHQKVRQYLRNGSSGIWWKNRCMSQSRCQPPDGHRLLRQAKEDSASTP
jgi:hypothetical protein